MAPLPVLAAKEKRARSIPLRVSLNELRVTGRLTRLVFTATNLLEPGSSNSWQIANSFGDNVSQMRSDDSREYTQDYASVDGVYLIDPAAGKRYLAARTKDGACVCSDNLSSTLVDAGNSIVLNVLFQALPAEVRKIDVYVPGFGTFEDVQVAR